MSHIPDDTLTEVLEDLDRVEHTVDQENVVEYSQALDLIHRAFEAGRQKGVEISISKI